MKHVLITITLISISSISITTFAQNMIFGASLGYKQIKAAESDIYFHYVDESPSRDNITTLVEVSDFRGTVDIGVWAESGYSNSANLTASARLYMGQVVGYDFGVGVNYAMPIGMREKLHILPGLSVGAGNLVKSLGTIHNNDVYIQVNDTRYDDYEDITASLSNFYLFVKPEISFSYSILRNNDLRFSFAFLLGTSSPSITFHGPVNGENYTESENLTEDNVYFRVDGEESHKSPFKATGFEVKVGLTFGSLLFSQR